MERYYVWFSSYCYDFFMSLKYALHTLCFFVKTKVYDEVYTFDFGHIHGTRFGRM